MVSKGVVIEMAKRRPALFVVIVLFFIVSACAKSPSSGAGGAIPVDNSSGQRIAKSQEDADFLDQTFDFSMDAYLKDFDMSAIAGGSGANLYPATLLSNWGGEFIIDPDGNLTGQGRLVTEATVFNVDEDWCGYGFTEKAEHEFQIGGKLKKQGDKFNFPVKIWSVTTLTSPAPEIGPPEATCEDPDPKKAEILGILIEVQREAMVSLVTQHLHQAVGDQIEFGIELEIEAGNVEYKIFVSPEAVDLN